jgi:hypothetical protein
MTRTIDVENGEAIGEAKVRTLPYKEAFLFWETEFPREKVLVALDEVYSFDVDCSPDAAGISRERLDLYYSNYRRENELYGRMGRFLELDLHEDTRLAPRDGSTFPAIDVRYGYSYP